MYIHLFHSNSIICGLCCMLVYICVLCVYVQFSLQIYSVCNVFLSVPIFLMPLLLLFFTTMIISIIFIFYATLFSLSTMLMLSSRLQLLLSAVYIGYFVLPSSFHLYSFIICVFFLILFLFYCFAYVCTNKIRSSSVTKGNDARTDKNAKQTEVK